MIKRGVLTILAIIFLGSGIVWAIDPPHGSYDCSACHSLHGATGPGLTNQATNAALCITCHTTTGAASAKPFNAGMEAVPGTSGTSHSWEGTMPSTSSPNNAYGLRATADLTNTGLKRRLQAFGDKVSCSVCHNQHSESNAAWDPFTVDTKKDSGTATGGTTTTVQDTSRTWAVDQWAGYSVNMTSGSNTGVTKVILSNTGNTLTVTSAFASAIIAGDAYQIIAPASDSGTASGGTTTTLNDTAKTWVADIWTGYYLHMTSGLNSGQEKVISGNMSNSITISTAFGSAIANGDSYYIYPGTHYQRVDNDLNQLCEDCHYYRTVASGQTAVETYTGNNLSHPVVKVFSSASGETPDVTDPTQFNTSPEEPGAASYAAQTGGIRYHLNGGTDTNLTNNIVLDSSGRVRCLSCHGIHYTDSDSTTVDGP